jgi:hypothetical protein
MAVCWSIRMSRRSAITRDAALARTSAHHAARIEYID